MISLSQFAAPAVLGTALFLGVQGCTHDRADEIPASATEISTGTESVTGNAPHKGMFYVWDQTANKMLYVGRADQGDTVRVDAKHNSIYIDDKLVTKRDDLINDHHYKIFFDRADRDRARSAAYSSEGANTTPGTTVIVPDSNGSRTTVVMPPQTTTPPPAQPQPGTTVVVPPSDSSRTTIQRETVTKEER
jgi:hypothetical protein